MAENDLKLTPVSGKGSTRDSKMGTFEHDLKIQINKLVKECEDHGIPIFVAFYSDVEKYFFQGLMPEEIGTPEVASQYGKFDEFFKTCVGFNKEENFKSSIHRVSE